MVTVQFYNETVQDHDVSTWLGRYGEVKSGARRVLDEDGIWTEARKWLVQLQPDPLAVGGGYVTSPAPSRWGDTGAWCFITGHKPTPLPQPLNQNPQHHGVPRLTKRPHHS